MDAEQLTGSLKKLVMWYKVKLGPGLLVVLETGHGD